MLFNFMRAKIHLASVNQKELDYTGSITIDENIIQEVGIYPNEKVQVLNLNNGKRIETYVIKGEKGSKIIGLNGPAARIAEIGDRLVIVAYAYGSEEEISNVKPKIVILNENNDVVERK